MTTPVLVHIQIIAYVLESPYDSDERSMRDFEQDDAGCSQLLCREQEPQWPQEQRDEILVPESA